MLVDDFAVQRVEQLSRVDQLAAHGSLNGASHQLGVASLVPTGLALYVVRGSERAARVISRVGMAVALTAPLCGVYMALAIRFGPHHPEMLVVTSSKDIRQGFAAPMSLALAAARARNIG